MSDIQLDLNEILDSLSREIATATKRAVIAEANIAARDLIIAQQREELSALKAAADVKAWGDDLGPQPAVAPDDEDAVEIRDGVTGKRVGARKTR